MFNVGDQVNLKVRFRSNLLFSKTGYEEHDFTGTVEKTPSYVSYDAVTVRTGNPEFPLSIIPLKSVVGYEQKEDKSVETFEITSGANTYTVSVKAGKVSCSCVGFQFRRYCKHSDPYKK